MRDVLNVQTVKTFLKVDSFAFVATVHVPDVVVAEVQMLLQLLHRFTAMLLLLMLMLRLMATMMLMLMLVMVSMFTLMLMVMFALMVMWGDDVDDAV